MYNSKIMIALDFSTREETLDFLKTFGDEKLFVKIGMELFYKGGFEIIEEIKAMGHNIFLDLKLYDIPNTVAQSIHSLGQLGVDMLTIHTSGGYDMMKAANDIAQQYDLKLLGVTILTSQDETDIIKTDYDLTTIINDLATKANDAGLFGIICSAVDIPGMRVLDNNLNYITPGIRLIGDSANDQKRVMTPNSAVANGANFIVVGRSITASKNPVATYHGIQELIGEK